MNKKNYKQLNQKERDRIFLFKSKGLTDTAIAGRLERLKYTYLNQESIYQFIYSLEGRKLNLRHYLRRAHRLRRPKSGRKPHQDDKIPHRTDISKRPKLIDKKRQFGHWEGDSLVYNRHRQVLSTSVERKTRKIIISKPCNRTAKEKSRVLIKRFKPLPAPARRTMTYDNGREAVSHQTVTITIGMKFYFAKTYSSWQRGTNENRNGLVRFYLPRDTDLNQLTWQQIRRVENLINNRPVKLLDYQTPNEAFTAEMNKLKSKL